MKNNIKLIKSRFQSVSVLGGWTAEHDEDIEFIKNSVSDIEYLLNEVDRLNSIIMDLTLMLEDEGYE